MKIVIAIPPTFYPRHSYGITGVGLTADPGVAEGAPDLGSEGRPSALMTGPGQHRALKVVSGNDCCSAYSADRALQRAG